MPSIASRKVEEPPSALAGRFIDVGNLRLTPPKNILLKELKFVADARCEALHVEVSAFNDRIMQAPATTLAGLAVKARILAYENDVQEPDEASIKKALLGAHYFEDRVAFPLALDVLRLARSAS